MLKSPVKFYTDEQYNRFPVPDRALLQAAAREGVRETGINAGFWVEKFLASVHLGPGYAWCAAFVHWCIEEAGVDNHRLPNGAAAVRNWASWAKTNHRLLDKPVRGCLFFWLDRAGTGHIGFVSQVGPGYVETLEGNTNMAGSREGDGVYRKARKLDWLASRYQHGFIDLADL